MPLAAQRAALLCAVHRLAWTLPEGDNSSSIDSMDSLPPPDAVPPHQQVHDISALESCIVSFPAEPAERICRLLPQAACETAQASLEACPPGMQKGGPACPGWRLLSVPPRQATEAAQLLWAEGRRTASLLQHVSDQEVDIIGDALARHLASAVQSAAADQWQVSWEGSVMLQVAMHTSMTADEVRMICEV